MPYQAINANEVDQDSPITEGLMQRFRDNLVFFLAQFDTSTGHDHDGDTDDGADITSFPSAVTASANVTITGTLTAYKFINYLAMFQAY